nr:hypothetical protein BaRGS_022450 [Batillaria attramentaria]
MDRPTEPGDVDYPTTDHARHEHDVTDSYNYHQPPSGVPNEAYDLEADVDDADKGYHDRFSSDHQFIPIGGNLAFHPTPYSSQPDKNLPNHQTDKTDINFNDFLSGVPSRDPHELSPAGAGDQTGLNPNESFDGDVDVKLRDEWAQRLKGMENEAYDGDAETDQSVVMDGNGQFQSIPLGDSVDDPNMRNKDPFPVLDSKLQLRCAYAWSCIACLIGNFLCAIPALRYTVTASESAKVHDYNSAQSYLRKAYILCAVGLAIAAGGWTVLILYLSGSIQT